MELSFDMTLSAGYKNHSQIARRITESWVYNNMFCPRCGCEHIEQFENNKPVADFYCPVCGNQYELKSKNGKFGKKINDGAYDTMIERITGNHNPDFFLMAYSSSEYRVRDIMLVPKHFFVPNIIERRKPLASTARRAGWVGCNILLNKIPAQGRITIISNGRVENKDDVLQKMQVAQSLKIESISARGWLMDILHCVNAIDADEFCLRDVYRFEDLLQQKHPDNNNVKPKIRQQLQFLRDKGIIEFLGNGYYRKVK